MPNYGSAIRQTNESGLIDAAKRETSAAVAITTLNVIAHGAWNAGRDEPITVEEYARQALAIVLRTEHLPAPSPLV